MSPSQYHELFITPCDVHTMSLCLYHKSKSIPRVQVRTMSPCLYHVSKSITWAEFVVIPNSEFCSKFGVFEQNTPKSLRNSEYIGLGITSALKMVGKSCLGPKIWPNEDEQIFSIMWSEYRDEIFHFFFLFQALLATQFWIFLLFWRKINAFKLLNKKFSV